MSRPSTEMRGKPGIHPKNGIRSQYTCLSAVYFGSTRRCSRGHASTFYFTQQKSFDPYCSEHDDRDLLCLDNVAQASAELLNAYSSRDQLHARAKVPTEAWHTLNEAVREATIVVDL